ncbi:hypothetical protein Tco_0335720 [Tanacetum coccineum]
MSTLHFAETHNMIVFLEKPAESNGFQEIIDFLNANQIYYALTVNPTIYTSCIEQFWATTKAKKVNCERQLQALVDKKKVIITETSIRSDFTLEICRMVLERGFFLLGGVLEKAKDAQAKEIVGLKKRVQKLERKKKSRTTGLKRLRKVGESRRVASLGDKESLGAPEDASKQGRIFEDFDKDAKVSLVDETQGRLDDAEMFDTDDLHGDEVIVDMPVGEKQEQSINVDEREVSTGVEDSVSPTISVTTAGKGVTTAIDELTLAQTLIEIKAAKPKAVTTAATTTTTTRPKARRVDAQAKEIAGLKKRVQKLERKKKSRTIALKRLRKVGESRRVTKKKEEEANIALIKSWENTQAIITADRLLAERLQTREQEELTDEEKAKLFMEFMEKRKKHFAALRAQEKRNRPPTKTQKRNQMSIYLKHMGGYKHNQLKGRSYAEIQKLFDKEMKRVNSFMAMNLEAQEISGKKDESKSDKSKKQKTDENEEVELDNEAELKMHMVIVKDDDIAIDVIPLATKPPMIVEYKLIKEGINGHYQLIRANGSSKRYSSMIRMLQGIDKEDLQTLWKLFKTKHGDIRPEDAHKRVLCGDLKVMFESDIKSDVWRTLQGYKVTVSKLFDSCGVHFVSTAGTKVYAAGLQLLEDLLLELIHHCLQNPPYTYQWAEKIVPVAEGSSETTTERYMENYKNVSQDIRDQLNAEAEAVQIILTGIDNDIYSTVDACPNACEMWKAIERLKQGESINVQDLETNLYWEFGKYCTSGMVNNLFAAYYSRFYKMMNELVRNQCHVTNHQVNVQFLLQLQPEWQRFVTLVKQSQELKTVSYHKLYDILKQHQNEVNEIRAERLARTANPLVLMRKCQKKREIDKLMALIFSLGTGYDNQRAVNVAGARENVGTLVVQKSGIQCYNCKEYGHLNAKQADWKDDIDDESEEHELEAHYMYMAQLQEVTPDPVENSGPIFDDEPMHKVQNNNDNYNVFAMEN